MYFALLSHSYLNFKFHFEVSCSDVNFGYLNISDIIFEYLDIFQGIRIPGYPDAKLSSHYSYYLSLNIL